MRKQSFQWLLANIIVLITIYTLYLSIKEIITGQTTRTIFGIGVGVMITLYCVYLVRLLNRNPKPLIISIFGFPNSGKTVYLTVLFDNMQRGKIVGFSFSPFGQETVERTMEDLSMLSRGKWLPSTPVGFIFPYRAIVTIGEFFFTKRRFRIEIGDVAGELAYEFDPSNDRWLHKSKYFNYVLQSDAILLVIDSDFMLMSNNGERDKVQNQLAAAIHLIAEDKGAIENKKFKTPIALIFLKSDVLKLHEARETVIKKINSLKLENNNLSSQESSLLLAMPSSTLDLSEVPAEEINEDDQVKMVRQNKELEKIRVNISNNNKIITDHENELLIIEEREKSKRNDIAEMVGRLIDICKERCEKFELFYVSSIGKLGPESIPPKKIQPDGIADPIRWILNEFI